MLSSASLDRSLHLLIEAVTHKQIARKQAPFMRTIEQEAARFFRKQGIAVGRAYAVTQLQEAAIDDVLAGADIGKLAAAIARSYVGGMAFAGAEYALGISFTLKNPRAVAYQKDRGVELLKELNETTKSDINELIIAGLEAGTSPEKIARSIRSLFVSYAATKRGKRSRAQLVAITETARAYSAGNHGAILDASGTGLAFEKSWLTANDDRVDPHCSANQSQGWIAMGADHSSGAQYPPDHPGCRCVERYRRITETKLDKVLYNAEVTIKDQAYESAYIFDRDGKQLLFKDGTRSEVLFTDDEAELLKDAILTHNHPSIGGSFSPQDVYLAITEDMAEMRAVGGKYRYSLTFPKGSIKKYFQNQIDEVERNVRKDLTEKIRNKEITPQQADLLYYHEVWTRFAITHKWKYERTEW